MGFIIVFSIIGGVFLVGLAFCLGMSVGEQQGRMQITIWHQQEWSKKELKWQAYVDEIKKERKKK